MLAAMTQGQHGVVARVGLEALFTAAGLPVVGSLVVTPLVERMVAEHRRRTSVAMRAAVRVSGCATPEDLAERLEADPRLQPLLVRLLSAASTNGHDQTLRALGKALGDAVREPHRIDQCDLLLQSLDGLTASHVELLLLLSEKSPQDDVVWQVAEVEKAMALDFTVYRLCRSSLYSRGIITEYTGFGGTVILEVSEAGKVLLDVLREHAAEVADEA